MLPPLNGARISCDTHIIPTSAGSFSRRECHSRAKSSQMPVRHPLPSTEQSPPTWSTQSICFCVLFKTYIFIVFIIYLLGCLGSQLWLVGSSSLTRDPTWGPLPWEQSLGPWTTGKSLFAHFNLRIICSEEISISLPIRKEHRGNGFRVHSEWHVKA